MSKNGQTRPVIRYGSGPTLAGHAFVALTERGLCALTLVAPAGLAAALAEARHRFPDAEFVEDGQAVGQVLRQVDAFVRGEATAGDLALDLIGTPFQQRVWQALRDVPRGTTCSYTELARRAGVPHAIRAVAGACASNPVAVFVPCHRIVRRDGGLGGYGGGLARKRELLRYENVPV
jgi:AraC family transcriptional regulator of adaptative response/methylated-DNA-[protein]-cysteine methyltransferase